MCENCTYGLEYKTSIPCRYCTHNNDRATYVMSDNALDVKDYYDMLSKANCKETQIVY